MRNQTLCESITPDTRERYWKIILREDGSIFVTCHYKNEQPQIVFDSAEIEPAEIKKFMEVTGLHV